MTSRPKVLGLIPIVHNLPVGVFERDGGTSYLVRNDPLLVECESLWINTLTCLIV